MNGVRTPAEGLIFQRAGAIADIGSHTIDRDDDGNVTGAVLATRWNPGVIGAYRWRYWSMRTYSPGPDPLFPDEGMKPADPDQRFELRDLPPEYLMQQRASEAN
jgi:hypothetical protein